MRARHHMGSQAPPQPRDGEKPMRVYHAPYQHAWHILAEETEMTAYALCGAQCYGPRKTAEGMPTCDACAAAETHRRRIARERQAGKPSRPSLQERLAAAREEGRRAGLDTAARLADELAERYRGDRFAPVDYREGWRDALSACARDLRGLEAKP